MPWTHVLIVRLRSLFQRARIEQELDAELQFHLAQQIEENLAAGMSAEDACASARRSVGSLAHIEDQCRDSLGLRLVDEVKRDVRDACRTLVTHPAAALIAVVSLALAIGATIAMFTVVDALLLRPFPYPDPDRIVRVTQPMGAQAFTMFGPAGFQIWPSDLQKSRLFNGMGLYVTGGLNLGGSTAERLRAASVTAGFFEALGAKLTLGRTFTAEDIERVGHVVVISHQLWQRRFGAAAMVGRRIVLNGESFLVTGVMPPRMDFPNQSDAWIASSDGGQLDADPLLTVLIARLMPGVTTGHAANEVGRLVGRNVVRRGGTIDPKSLVMQVTPLHRAITEDTRPFLLLIASGALLALLGAGLNTANLLVTLVSARRQDFAVRRALGASDLSLARQLLCESALLAIAAGGAAVPAAGWVLDAVRAFVPTTVHAAAALAINARALAATAVISLIVAALCASVSSMSLRGRALSEVLRGASVAAADPIWRRVRSAVVMTQVAIAFVLLAGGVTVVRKVAALMAVDLGVRAENALVVDLALPRAIYGSPELIRQFFQRFEGELRGHPEVVEIAVASGVPGDVNRGGAELLVDGEPTPPGGQYLGQGLSVSPRYFSALGIDLLAGRPFVDTDRVGASSVAIVSEGFARNFGMGPADIVGRRALLNHHRVDIVGVVRDVRMRGPEGRFEPATYVPFAQEPIVYGPLHVVVTARTDAKELIPSVREAGARADRNVPPFAIRSVDEIRASDLAQRRFVMTMMLVFGGLAFAVAAVGLHGVLTYLVQQRRHEIGVRMALGASPARVKWGVLAIGLWQAIGGVGLGVACALAVSRMVATSIPALGQFDMRGAAVVSGTMLAVSIAATWLPAHRATRIDPVQTIRFG
jgi:predicted permease